MNWSVVNIDYLDSPSEALNTEIQISSVVVDHLNHLPLGGFFKCPIAVMDRYSLKVQVFFPPELEIIALFLGARLTTKPDFYSLKGSMGIQISPIGLDAKSPYFQSLFVKPNHSQ